jgi:hypothetical protein
MRAWVISGAVVMGGISLVRTGDPGLVIAATSMGAVIGVILYGLFVAFTSAARSVWAFSNAKGVSMKQFIWVGVLLVAIAVNAMQTNFEYALGYTLPWFIIGLVLTPIWWGITKKVRQSPWRWFDWLNAGSYIMLILFILRMIVHAYMASQRI